MKHADVTPDPSNVPHLQHLQLCQLSLRQIPINPSGAHKVNELLADLHMELGWSFCKVLERFGSQVTILENQGAEILLK